MPTFLFKPLADPAMAPEHSHIDEILRLRHEVFKVRLGWDVKSWNGREIDDYDIPGTVYGAAVGWSGTMEGCFRLLPTTGPYMLADVFPELLHDRSVPRDRRVLESSRFAVLPEAWRPNQKRRLIEITCRLLIAQLMYCLEIGVTKIVSVTDVRFERILRSAGLLCERFGPPVRVGKVKAVAGWLHVTQNNLRNVSSVLDDLSSDDTTAHLPNPTCPKIQVIQEFTA